MKAHILIISAFLFVTNMKAQLCAPLPVPFHEDFNSVTAPMQWPTCWTSTMGSLLSAPGPDPYAACLASGDNYFNSPDFILNAGYTYSISMRFWQSTDSKLWNKVALHLVKGLNQNLGIVASGTDFSTIDTLIGGTFSVVNTGTYHIGVQTLKINAFPPPMTLSFFDDLRIDCANNMFVYTPAMVCIGESVELLGVGATSYTFQSSSGSSQDNPYIDYPLADETYTASGVIYGNCVDTRTVAVKVSECLGLEEPKLKANLYPNPFHDHLVLRTERGRGMVTIFDLVGNTVYSHPVTDVSTEIRPGELKPGVYVLQFVDGTEKVFLKLIRE